MRDVATKAPGFSPVQNVLAAQLAVSLAVSLGLVAFDRNAALSGAVGGLINVVATTYAGWRIFRFNSQGSPDRELFNVYRSEVGKLVVIGGLCAVTFAVMESVNIVAFIGVFSATLVVGLVAAAWRSDELPTNAGR
ncbi:MAG: ATP synthase subunit I [Gammaproteobacteria bacterium]|nr:ATP synthase subunit I [Gammaproteobacteria bacterium]